MIRILQENLNTALNIVKTGLPARPVLPILNNVLIEIDEYGMATFTTNDLETVTQYSIGCKVDSDPFSVCLPCKFLADVVNELHNDLVEVWQHIENGQKVTTFKCNRQTINLNGYDPADYPPTPKTEGQSIIIYDLADAIKNVKDLLTDSNGDRYNQRNTEGLLFDFDAGLIVATDRNRMKIAHINTTQEGIKFRISKKAATMLLKCKDTVNVTYQPPDEEGRNSHIKFESSNTTIITQNLETNSKYPDYQKVAEDNKELVTVY